MEFMTDKLASSFTLNHFRCKESICVLSLSRVIKILDFPSKTSQKRQKFAEKTTSSSGSLIFVKMALRKLCLRKKRQAASALYKKSKISSNRHLLQ